LHYFFFFRTFRVFLLSFAFVIVLRRSKLILQNLFTVVLRQLVGHLVENVAPADHLVVKVLLDDLARNLEVGVADVEVQVGCYVVVLKHCRLVVLQLAGFDACWGSK
jgi:hypothetical protein